jgi:putative oxidoreductase
MTLSLLRTVDEKLNPLRHMADKIGAPLLDCGIRLYMGQIFLRSGWQKLQSALNDDWGSTVYLFQDIHPIPHIPAHIAAVAGTAGEVALPILLIAGLFGRFAAAGLIVMTMVIQFIVPASYEISSPTHYLWMLLLAVIFVRGAGALSLDTLLRRFISSAK